MIVEKIEPVTDADRALCAAFKKAKGMAEDRTIESCGLGWVASYARDEGGLGEEGAMAFYQRLYFDTRKNEAALFDYMQAAGAPVSAAQAREKLQGQGFTPLEAQSAVQRALSEQGFVMLDRDMKLRLMRKGDVKYFMG